MPDYNYNVSRALAAIPLEICSLSYKKCTSLIQPQQAVAPGGKKTSTGPCPEKQMEMMITFSFVIISTARIIIHLPGNMKLINVLVTVAFCLTTALPNAQLRYSNVGSTATDSLSRTITGYGEQFVSATGHYGLSIGLIKNGTKYSFHFGTTENGKQVKPTDSTIYEIASVTKSFTGILLAHAILEKRITLTDDIRQFLSTGFLNLSYKGIPITVEHLATHTSGLPKFVPALDNNLSPDQMMKRYNNFSEMQFLEVISGIKLDTVPGSKFIYSNADAQLIGIILEKIYHSTYSELLKRYIGAPQEMNDTQLEIKNGDKIRYAKGYNSEGKLMPMLRWWKNTPAAGYIKSTVGDMLKYLQLNIDETDPAIVLAHQPVSKVTEEGADSIGLFWFIKKSPQSARIIYHSGGSFGTTSYCEIRPGEKNGIVLLANDASAGTEQQLKILADLIMKIEK
jgi:serine-type D-Ala-D-Ala carboxypeptidase/endopeptidase